MPLLGSPFIIPVGEPPDPRKVKVYGPGIESGVIQRYESKFIVETYGAGAGQLSVRIRGPRGMLKHTLDMMTRLYVSENNVHVFLIHWSCLLTDIKRDLIPSRQAHDVNITSLQRQCNVMTLHRR